jgi:uncharacterized protein YnzC (UPF0291/DUF896 family)
LGDSTTCLFDDFINKTGASATLLRLLDGPAKEGPTKIRDVINKLEQIINSHGAAGDDNARDAEINKLSELKESFPDTKSIWYLGDVPEAKTVGEITSVIRAQIAEAKAKPSPLGKELEAKQTNFTQQMRKGSHDVYEKLDVDSVRLLDELTNDLTPKLNSLQKQVSGGSANRSDAAPKRTLFGRGATPAGSAAAEQSSFAKEAIEIIRFLLADITALGNLLHATSMLCNDYSNVVKGLLNANKSILDKLHAMAKKNKATELSADINKVQNANSTLIRKFGTKYS